MRLFKFKILVIIITLFFSCTKKSENKIVSDTNEDLNLEQMIEKYSNYNFSNCDEFIKVGDQIIDTYIKTVDLAFDGDMNAYFELNKYPEFMEKLDTIADKFYIDCPEKIDNWINSIEKRTSLSNKKIMAISSSENDSISWDESVEDELNRQIEELQEDLKRIADEENKLSSSN
ncbi:MAG TPA: hypothetical protein PLW77_07705 [Bacteroidales bacterium]|nr:hypothetical protein [Bacteroidales bacterium]HQB22075.1 hypothetical protein [Bacteroidales bacterium]